MKNLNFLMLIIMMPTFILAQESGTFTDSRDNQTYKWVKIGTQVWMAENLKATKYRDGTVLPNVTDKDSWADLGSDDIAWCYYDNDSKNVQKYGVLYTWAAATLEQSSKSNPSGIKGVCPDGWHLPSNAEWEEMAEFINKDKGVYSKSGNDWKNVGGHLKAANCWNNDGNGTDDYGFLGLPGGNRDGYGYFNYLGEYGYWWSTTEEDKYSAWYRSLYYDDSNLATRNHGKEKGRSVRCVKDSVY